MDLDILISTSFGLCVNDKGEYFAHIISDNEDYGGKRHDVFLPITPKKAKQLSRMLKVEILECRLTDEG